VLEPHFQLPHWTWDAYLSAVCGLALWKGGRSERIGGVAIFLGWVATVLVMKPGWWEASGLVVAVDSFVLAILVWLALTSHRYWPIAAAAFQLLAIVTHWAHSLDHTVGNWAYVTAGIIWGYLLVAALAVGTFTHWRWGRGASPADPSVAKLDATRR
jgi:hypothetical protein